MLKTRGKKGIVLFLLWAVNSAYWTGIFFSCLCVASLMSDLLFSTNLFNGLVNNAQRGPFLLKACIVWAMAFSLFHAWRERDFKW